MCACGELSPSFVCSAHRGTRFDPVYFDEPDEKTPEELERDAVEQIWRETVSYGMVGRAW